MRKKKGLNLVERASIAVPGLEEVANRMAQKVELSGQSMSTYNNYQTKADIYACDLTQNQKIPQKSIS